LLAIVLQMCAIAPAAAAPPLTLGRFTSQLQTLASAVERSPADAAPRLAATIADVETVASGADLVEVHFEWLRLALGSALIDGAKWPARRADLAAELRAMAREASVVTPAVRPAGARDTLTRTLAMRGFQNTRSLTWQARLLQRLKAWLADLWERTLGRRVGQRTVAVVLAWMVSIAAIAVLLIWLTRLAAGRRAEGPSDLGSVEAPRTAGRTLALEAAALARAGRVREAARVAYRAAVHRLEEEGALRVDETRTPREYLRLLPAPHRRHAALVSLTEAFERIWYGSRPPAPRDGETIIALLQDLECLSPDRAS
jgi:hypothetical protein